MTLYAVDQDLTALTVLAVLHTGPRDVGAMHRFVVDTHKDFVVGTPESLSAAVRRLFDDDLVAAGDDPGAGTVYTITPDGERVLLDRVRELLEIPHPDLSLMTAALSFVGVLRPLEASAALRTRTDELTARLDAIDAELSETLTLPRFLVLELDFERAQLVAQREWADGLAAEIESGVLTWPARPAWRPEPEPR